MLTGDVVVAVVVGDGGVTTVDHVGGVATRFEGVNFIVE